jgi:DNA-binding NarL/FixJ family response regulator
MNQGGQYRRRLVMDTYRVVLADDHAMFRKGIKKILESAGNIEVVGEAKDGIELLKILREKTPHMVILDVPMSNFRGIEATQVIKTINPEIKVLVLAEQKGRSQVHQAISAGAEGYLLKEDKDTDLLLAIEKIRMGKNYLSPLLPTDLAEACSPMLAEHGLLDDGLTPRENEILSLIAEGKTNKEIAHMLFLSVRTVECHRLKIMRKLNVRNASELVRYFLLRGFQPVEE